MRQPPPRPNRRASTAILLVAVLTLSLSPASAAAAAECWSIPTSCPADNGDADGWFELLVADEAGQCDPETGELTGSARRSSSYGYPDGDQDYLVGEYTLTGQWQSMYFAFCMEIDPIEDTPDEAWGNTEAWWEGEGSGVIFDHGQPTKYRMPSLRLVPHRAFGAPDSWGLLEWRIAGRYHEAADPDIGGVFQFANILSISGYGSGVWNMMRDTY